jgi:hypothetical protein
MYPKLLVALALTAAASAEAAPCTSYPSRDCDGDGLINSAEQTAGTNKSIADTDADGLNDGQEVLVRLTNPKVKDTDGDGLWDGPEVNTHLTNPKLADTDADALSDGAEVNTWHTNPLDKDSDDDFLTDGAEVNVWHSDPLDADPDEDGYTDNYETTYHTDPFDPDTDADGVSDLDDCFPLDPNEWDDFDGDGRGDNSDLINIVPDAQEIVGGAPIAGRAFPIPVEFIFCGTVMDVALISTSNTKCRLYTGIQILENGTFQIGTSVGSEWDEWQDGNDVWHFRMGGPTLAHASIRRIGPQVIPQPGFTTCYEGELQAAGGGYNVSTDVEWLYYFQNGVFRMCL